MKTLRVTFHQNRLFETILMSGHIMVFGGETLDILLGEDRFTSVSCVHAVELINQGTTDFKHLHSCTCNMIRV